MLNDVEKGSSCLITDTDSLDSLVKRRLQDFGLTIGTKVNVKGAAPFGGPILLDVNGQTIAIRRNDAKKIGVKIGQ